MDETRISMEEFLTVLASASPTPGGGGVAALSGALAAALSGMVCGLTLGKKKYAAVEADVLRLQERAAGLREKLYGLIAGDAEAFAPLAAAYGLPAETGEQKAHKAAVMEQALVTAASVPLEMMEACCRTAELLDELKDVGASIAISDVGCGAACCRAALQSGALNVYANTKFMRDRAVAASLEHLAGAMLARYVPLCDGVYDSVAGRMRE